MHSHAQFTFYLNEMMQVEHMSWEIINTLPNFEEEIMVCYIKSISKVHKKNATKFVIVYIGKPLAKKTS